MAADQIEEWNGWGGGGVRWKRRGKEGGREKPIYMGVGGHPATTTTDPRRRDRGRGPEKDGKRETLFSFLPFRFFPFNFRGIFGVHGGCSGAHLEKYMSTMEGEKNTKRECFDLQICFAQK